MRLWDKKVYIMQQIYIEKNKKRLDEWNNKTNSLQNKSIHINEIINDLKPSKLKVLT